jgi:hypothetical protein
MTKVLCPQKLMDHQTDHQVALWILPVLGLLSFWTSLRTIHLMVLCRECHLLRPWRSRTAGSSFSGTFDTNHIPSDRCTQDGVFYSVHTGCRISNWLVLDHRMHLQFYRHGQRTFVSDQKSTDAPQLVATCRIRNWTILDHGTHLHRHHLH